MKGRGIKRVCCFLRKEQLAFYIDDDLLETYRREFGPENVCWAPVEDYHLCEATTLQERILPFLQESQVRGSPTVVHCSGGSGRTGHVLAAWLVFGRRFDIEQALAAVTEMRRTPRRQSTAVMRQRRSCMHCLKHASGGTKPPNLAMEPMRYTTWLMPGR
jgi:protein-tyrosine phosphatase